MLIVDDSAEISEVLKLQYECMPGVQVVATASCIAQALDVFTKESIEFVSIDIQLGRENGFELCALLRQKYPKLFIVVCSLEADSVMRRQATIAGANSFVAKPAGIENIGVVLDEYAAFRTALDDKSEENWIYDVMENLP